jgi:hypothetical protein
MKIGRAAGPAAWSLRRAAQQTPIKACGPSEEETNE